MSPSRAAAASPPGWTNYGAAIAAVVAEDWEIARYACSLISIKYVTLPVVFDADAAMVVGSTLSAARLPATTSSPPSPARILPATT